MWTHFEVQNEQNSSTLLKLILYIIIISRSRTNIVIDNDPSIFKTLSPSRKRWSGFWVYVVVKGRLSTIELFSWLISTLMQIIDLWTQWLLIYDEISSPLDWSPRDNVRAARGDLWFCALKTFAKNSTILGSTRIFIVFFPISIW